MAIAFCPNSAVVLIPSSGTVSPSSSQAMIARLKSCCLPDGISQSTLTISSNDPVTPTLNIPVTIDVSQPPLAVTDLVITAEAADVRLRWSAATRANSYNIYRSSNYPVEAIPANHIANTTDTTYLDTATVTTGYYLIISVR